MPRFLVIEDDQDKLRNVTRVLKEAGVGDQDVDIARDVASAQRLLAANAYDLAVLDVVLPIQPYLEPHPNAGVELLAEISDGAGRYKVPGVIVGLTAFDQLRPAVVPVFEAYLSCLLRYQADDEQWKERLRRRIRSILVRDSAKDSGEPAALCVIVALIDPELEALHALGWEWKPLELDDTTNYFEGQVKTKNGALKRVVAAAAPRMGLVTAAVLATKMVYRFRPTLLAMCGIIAGVEGECQLGDAICAEYCWDWGSGKHAVVKGVPRFKQAPYQYKLDAFLKARFERLASNGQTLRSVRDRWPADKPPTELRLHIGPVASGAAVVASDDVMQGVTEQHRKAVGVDMEAYSVFAAAAETIIPEPNAFVIKGVSDFGGESKDDSVRRYAAFVSANLLDAFVKDLM